MTGREEVSPPVLTFDPDDLRSTSDSGVEHDLDEATKLAFPPPPRELPDYPSEEDSSSLAVYTESTDEGCDTEDALSETFLESRIDIPARGVKSDLQKPKDQKELMKQVFTPPGDIYPEPTTLVVAPATQEKMSTSCNHESKVKPSEKKKQEKLKKRLRGRGRRAPKRGSENYLSNFDQIWALQSFLLSEADRTGISIIANNDKEKATTEIMSTIVDVMEKNFTATPSQVFGHSE